MSSARGNGSHRNRCLPPIARHLMRSTASNVAGQIVVLGIWFALTPSLSTSSVPRTASVSWLPLVAYGTYSTLATAAR
jgi:hypothetical protein